MKAELEIEVRDPESVVKALEPDGWGSRFSVVLRTGPRKLYIEVAAKNISALLAGINSCLKLVRLTQELDGV